jgi:formimidoylglutamase
VSAHPPHTRPGAEFELKPGRFAARLARDVFGDCRAALLGLPDDLGVQLNGGRAGAANGPTEFRATLARFGADFDGLAGRDFALRLFDAGDVVPAPGNDAAALAETHCRVEAAVAFLHAHGLVPICVGGGHDLSLPAITALSRNAGRALGGINLDAHLDVRARIGSGMPFRRLIEENSLDPARFAEVGLGRFSNERGDLEWAAAQGARLIFAESLLEQGLDTRGLVLEAGRAGPAFVSIDLDGLDQSVAPGVSAPNPFGVPLRFALGLAEAAGASPNVRHFDLMEYCPRFDLDGRTGRAAVLLFLHFLAGLAERPA